MSLADDLVEAHAEAAGAEAAVGEVRARRDRLAWRLHAEQRWSYGELATLLGVRRSTVQDMVRRGEPASQ